MTVVPSGAATILLRCACGLGLAAAVLTVGDTMTTVLNGSAARGALERAYVARSGSSPEQAATMVGGTLAGAFVIGLAFAAAIAALALLAPRASRGVRTGLVICTLLALPGAFGSLWALGRAVLLVAALGCALARPSRLAFESRRSGEGAPTLRG